MTRRSRVLTFGGAGLLVAAGVACAVTIGGDVGQVLALVLVGVGFVVAVSLVFYEIGLSEDHERGREERALARAAEAARRARQPRSAGRALRRLERMRGQRRRLR